MLSRLLCGPVTPTAPRRITPAALAAVAAALVAAAPAAATTTTTTASLTSSAHDRTAVLGAGGKITTPAATRPASTLLLHVADRHLGAVSSLTFRGSLRFTLGRRSVTLTSLRAQLSSTTASVSAQLAGRRTTVLRGRVAKGALQRTVAQLRLAVTALKLTNAGARALARALKADVRAGRTLLRLTIRTTVAPAAPAPAAPRPGSPRSAGPGPGDPSEPVPDDPYKNRCTIPVMGTAGPGTPSATPPGPPAPTPTLTAPVAVTGTITWGFKASFRSYVQSGGGAPPTPPIGTWDGAIGNGPFGFPVSTGQLEDGGTPRAIVPGAGAVVFCHPGHGFRISILNPTVTIDGGSSRLTADVERNDAGRWKGQTRVDLANLALNAVTPQTVGQTTTWAAIPARLTADGAKLFDGFYATDEVLDPVTLSVTRP